MKTKEASLVFPLPCKLPNQELSVLELTCIAAMLIRAHLKLIFFVRNKKSGK